MWFWKGETVSLPSSRVSSSVCANGMFVKRVWLPTSELRRRPAAKNQTLSFQIGPPRVPSYVGMVLSTWFSPNGVLSFQLSLSRLTRKEPLKLLPPDFVIALITPPVKRPYSAEMPELDVVVSAIASSMKRLFGVPRMLSMTLTPFTMNRLSNVWPPEIVVLPVAGSWRRRGRGGPTREASG